MSSLRLKISELAIGSVIILGLSTRNWIYEVRDVLDLTRISVYGIWDTETNSAAGDGTLTEHILNEYKARKIG